MLLLVMSCGSDGKDGGIGPAGPSGPAGEAGPSGPAGTDSGALASVLSCSGVVSIPLNAFWTGMVVNYQRAETNGGDVYVSAYTGGKADINESATAFYKKGMTGADKGAVTVGAGDGNYIILETIGGSELNFQGRGTAGDVGQLMKGCTLY
jgi:hypothetical protein